LETELLNTVDELDGYSFSTLDFVEKFKIKHHSLWITLVDKYGEGGKGCGTRYSAISFISQQLNKLHNSEELEKLDYRKAPPEFGNSHIRYWAANKQYQDYPDEISDVISVIEGAKKQITINRYERDRAARTKCIEKHGLSCAVCNFNFESSYGSRGAGFIHVHHLKPLGEIGESYKLNPVKDLRPVCPNCHAMLHRTIPAISIEELQTNITSK